MFKDLIRRNKTFLSLPILSIVTILITIIFCVYIQPWFRMNSNAFSDLGAIYTKYNYTFNIGFSLWGFIFLIFTFKAHSIITSIHSQIFIRLSQISSITTFFVSLFPEGTDLHIPICGIFFGLSVLILIFTIFDLYKSGVKDIAQITSLILLVYILYSILPLAYNVSYINHSIIKWPSQAIPELIAIFVFIYWTFIILSKRYLLKTK